MTISDEQDAPAHDFDGEEDASTRDRILSAALAMMSGRGADATTMRDLAAAVGLNVASIYHYFPSKQELFDRVVSERGELSARARMPSSQSTESENLVTLMSDLLGAMVEVEEFVRLMMGETIRGDETAQAVGLDLVSTFHRSLEDWLVDHRSDEEGLSLVPETSRLLCAMLVGTFFEYEAGAVEGDVADVTQFFRLRAEEALKVLNLGGW